MAAAAVRSSPQLAGNSRWSLLWGTPRHPQPLAQYRGGHTVRIIITKDVSSSSSTTTTTTGETSRGSSTSGTRMYAGDIVTVAAGYARNYLIPKQFAVYATRSNFQALNIKDPNLESADERRLRLQRESEVGADKDLKDADLLRFYLRNKLVRSLS